MRSKATEKPLTLEIASTTKPRTPFTEETRRGEARRGEGKIGKKVYVQVKEAGEDGRNAAEGLWNVVGSR